MIVVIGGMYRSGSTFVFNVVRELLEKQGSVFTIYTDNFSEISSLEKKFDHIIIKSHAPDDALTTLISHKTVKCICSFRKPEDAIASWFKTFHEDIQGGLELVKSWLLWHKKVEAESFNINFDSIDSHPLRTIFAIQWYLLKSINLVDAYKISNKYNKATLKKRLDTLTESDQTSGGYRPNGVFTYFENNTLFHRRHISSLKPIPATQTLEKQEIALIRDSLSEFVDNNGNLK